MMQKPDDSVFYKKNDKGKTVNDTKTTAVWIKLSGKYMDEARRLYMRERKSLYTQDDIRAWCKKIEKEYNKMVEEGFMDGSDVEQRKLLRLDIVDHDTGEVETVETPPVEEKRSRKPKQAAA
jgi:hypothetical protein